MTRVSASILLAVTLACATATFAWRSASPSAAATPKPTATGTPAPTATPLPAGFIHLRAVDDLNENGREDAGERGIAGARWRAGCEDAFVQLTADGNGDYVGPSPRDEGGRGFECFYLDREFGWLTTDRLSYPIPAGPVSGPFTFKVHVLGPTVMELHADVILRGLPETNVSFSRAAPPFTGGGIGCVEPMNEGAGVTLMILGSDLRRECPSKGDRFSIVMEGQVVGTFAFEPKGHVPDELIFVAGGDSMLVAATEADGARIEGGTGAECAVVRRVGGGLTPPQNLIYVLSDEARAGCGTPGKFVRFTKDGRPLAPLVPWHAGAQNGGIEFNDAKPRVITPPNTGSAGLLPGARAD